MENPAPAQHPIHDIIARRWSPRAFADRPVEPVLLQSLFEAARWAPSSGNEQPWNFIVATKENPEEFSRALSALVPGNQKWVKDVPVLAFNITRLNWSRKETPNHHAQHDAGLAAACLVLQATALGLQAHQMAGIHPDKVKELYGVPDGYEVMTGIAIGYPGDPNTLPEELKQRELAPRVRKPIESFVFAGCWDSAASFAAGKT